MFFISFAVSLIITTNLILWYLYRRSILRQLDEQAAIIAEWEDHDARQYNENQRLITYISELQSRCYRLEANIKTNPVEYFHPINPNIAIYWNEN